MTVSNGLTWKSPGYKHILHGRSDHVELTACDRVWLGANSRGVAKILRWGSTQAERWSMIFSKNVTNFFSRRPQNGISEGPQNTSGRENCVTLLNKAGHMTQQSHSNTQSTIVDTAPPPHAPCPLATPLDLGRSWKPCYAAELMKYYHNAVTV